MKRTKFLLIGLLALSMPVVSSLAGCDIVLKGDKGDELPSLVIAQLPYKVNYQVGETYTSAGLKITDKKGNEITEYQATIPDLTVLPAVGEFTNTIRSKGFKSTSFTIRVSNNGILNVFSLPNKTSYVKGDMFDTNGLIIMNNNGVILYDYQFELSIKNGQVLNEVGEIKVEVTSEGYDPTYFFIVVKDKPTGGYGVTNTPVGERKLDIHYVNDTHGSFSKNDAKDEVGMTCIASYMQQKKADGHSLILSGGDMFQGGVESNCTYGQIMAEAMNIAGFDAMVVGNHEFDWGEEKLKALSETANFPFISCNIFYNNTKEKRPSWLTPYTIIERNHLKIGIIGFARENMGSSILSSIASNFTFPNPNSYIKSYSTLLRNSFNCDLIIAAGHDEGYDTSTGREPTKFKELTNNDPVTNLPYIDGLFLAHDHNRKSGKINSIPYLETGSYGKSIGRISYILDNTSGKFQIKSSEVNLTYSNTVATTPNSEVEALLEKYKDLIVNPDTVLYNFKHSYSRDDFVVVVCKAMAWAIHTNPQIFDNEKVTYVTHNIAGIKKSVSSGAFTYADLEEVCPHDNAITIQKCTQTQVEFWQTNTSNAVYATGVYSINNGITNIGTCSYVAENYGKGHQQSYKEYDEFTSKSALFEFLRAKADTTL